MNRLRLFALGPAIALLAATATFADDKPQEGPNSVLSFNVKDIDGQDVDLSQYRGDVALIVNVASECGYTPQYEGLEQIYKRYKDRGFTVLGFPANEFGQQEPGTNAEIKQFCTSKFGVTFPMFSKIIVKGPGIHPLYQFLTSEQTNPEHAGEIPWNFTKFLVNRQGEVIARFAPKDKPESEVVTQAIEQALAQPK